MQSALYYLGSQIFPSGFKLRMIINLIYNLLVPIEQVRLLPAQGDAIFKTSNEPNQDKVCLTKMCC